MTTIHRKDAKNAKKIKSDERR